MSAPRTSARGACTPSWSGCWRLCPSMQRTATAPMSSSIANTSRAISASSRRLRIYRPTSSEAVPVLMPQPTEIKLRTQSRILDVRFDDGSHFELPFEYLRVFSPSAEVKGHGGAEGILQIGKENVRIIAVEPVGNYALRLVFDDGHNTGLYSWSLLHELGRNARANWARYLERCAAAGVRRT